VGTYDGKRMNVGSSTVNVGISSVRFRFDLCAWKSLAVSLVFTNMASEARNIRSSIVTFVWLMMSMLVP